MLRGRVVTARVCSNRVKEPHGDGHQYNVVDESPYKVDLDSLESLLRDSDRIEYVFEAVLHCDDTSSLNCDV